MIYRITDLGFLFAFFGLALLSQSSGLLFRLVCSLEIPCEKAEKETRYPVVATKVVNRNRRAREPGRQSNLGIGSRPCRKVSSKLEKTKGGKTKKTRESPGSRKLSYPYPDKPFPEPTVPC